MLDAENPRYVGGVVGTVGEPEAPSSAQAASVASVVEGDDAKPRAERAERGEPVEIGRGGPAVEQDEGRGPWRSIDLTYEQPAFVGKLDPASRRECGLPARVLSR